MTDDEKKKLIVPPTDPAEAAEEEQKLLAGLAPAMQKFFAFIHSDEWRKLQDKMQEFMQAPPPVMELVNETIELAAFLEEVLKDPVYQGRTIEDLYLLAYSAGQIDAQEIPTEDSLFMQAMRAAREAWGRANKFELVTYQKANQIKMNIDKFPGLFFSKNAPDTWKNGSGEMLTGKKAIPLKYERTGNDIVTLYYNFDIAEDILKRLNLEKKMDAEDFFILSFLAMEHEAGNSLISVNHLYKEMNGKEPNATQLERLTKKAMKLAAGSVYINNKEFVTNWKGYDKEYYREAVFPLANISVGTTRAIAGGQIIDTVIKIYGPSEILKLGREIGQFTTISKSVFQVKRIDRKTGKQLQIKKNSRYYRVLFYLLREVSQINSGHRNATNILYSTFYREVGETTTNGKRRAKELLYIMLEHFKNEGWIKGYYEKEAKKAGEYCVYIIPGENSKRLTNNKKGAAKKK